MIEVENVILTLVLILTVSSCASNGATTVAERDQPGNGQTEDYLQLIVEQPSPKPRWAEEGSDFCEANATIRGQNVYHIGEDVKPESATNSRVDAMKSAQQDAKNKMGQHIGIQIDSKMETSTLFESEVNQSEERYNAKTVSKELRSHYFNTFLPGVSFPRQYTAKYRDRNTGDVIHDVKVCARMSKAHRRESEKWRETHKQKLTLQVNNTLREARNLAQVGQFLQAISKLQLVLNDSDYSLLGIAEVKKISSMKLDLLAGIVIEPVTSAEQKVPVNSVAELVRARVLLSYGGQKLPVPYLPMLFIAADGTMPYERSAKTDSNGYVELKLPEGISKYARGSSDRRFRLDFDVEGLQVSGSTDERKLLESKGIDYRFQVEDSMLLLGNNKPADFELTLNLNNSTIRCDVRCYISIHGLSVDGASVDLLQYNSKGGSYQRGKEINFSIPQAKSYGSLIVLASTGKQSLFNQLKPETTFSYHEFHALLKIFQNYDSDKSILHEKL